MQKVVSWGERSNGDFSKLKEKLNEFLKSGGKIIDQKLSNGYFRDVPCYVAVVEADCESKFNVLQRYIY